MAFSLKRFVAWFVVGAVAIWAGWVGATESRRFSATFYWSSDRFSPKRQADRLDAVIGVLDRRDSIVRALRARPPARGLSVVMANAATPSERARLDSTIRAFWRVAAGAAGAAAATPTVVLVTNDGVRQSSQDIQPSRVSFVLVPTQSDGRSCVVVASSAGIGELGAAPKSRISVETLALMLKATAGVCVLYAKYGPPGASIRQWLASMSWNPAASTETVARRVSPGATPSLSRLDSVSSSARTSAGLAFDSRFLGESFAWRLGFEQIACLAGRAHLCEAAVHATDVRVRYRNPLLPADIVLSPVGLTRAHSWNRQLLASLEEQVGPAKFAAFWTSPREPNDAMVDASGRTIGAWVNDRLHERHSTLIASPWPTAFEWFVQLALIGAPIGAMVLGARRRFINP